MKKAFLLVLALFLATSACSQNGGSQDQLNPQPLPPHKHPGIEATDKKETNTKTNKSGKKGAKKGAAATPTPAPSPAAK